MFFRRKFVAAHTTFIQYFMTFNQIDMNEGI